MPIITATKLDSHHGTNSNPEVFMSRESNDPSRPDAIQEVPEPGSPGSTPASQRSPITSVLTELIRAFPPAEEEVGATGGHNSESGSLLGKLQEDEVTSRASERTPLIRKEPASGHSVPSTRTHDLESQNRHSRTAVSKVRKALTWRKEHAFAGLRRITRPKTWDTKSIWKHGLLQPAIYLPAVILGLLLNILDALSYGTLVVAATLSEWHQLISYRHDFIPFGSTNIRKPRYRWHLHVLC